MHLGYGDDEYSLLGKWDYAKLVRQASADVRRMGGKVPGRRKGEKDRVYWKRITSVRDRLSVQGNKARAVTAAKNAAKTVVKQAAATGTPVPASAVQAVAKTRAWLEGRDTDELLEELLARLDSEQISVEPEAYIAPLRPPTPMWQRRLPVSPWTRAQLHRQHWQRMQRAQRPAPSPYLRPGFLSHFVRRA